MNAGWLLILTISEFLVSRYGREDEETLGLCFKKELTLDEVQVFPPTKEAPPTRLQERLLSKLGKSALPFHLSFPPNSPTSVMLHQVMLASHWSILLILASRFSGGGGGEWRAVRGGVLHQGLHARGES